MCPAGDLDGRGCAEERADALAAYTQALLHTVTGKQRHADKARDHGRLVLEKDGPAPLTVPGSGLATARRMTAYWSGQATYRDGVAQAAAAASKGGSGR
ncbi:hypothetical protein [Streptomyces coeruleorubidus]|uniref:hypothetical protein n=1 Tax=Streptomyces coeruleorubidus TaxID=116188 RepID=UPI0033F9B834